MPEVPKARKLRIFIYGHAEKPTRAACGGRVTVAVVTDDPIGMRQAATMREALNRLIVDHPGVQQEADCRLDVVTCDARVGFDLVVRDVRLVRIAVTPGNEEQVEL